MKKKVFTGAATALVTPFKDGKVDFDSFEKIVERQINGNISALVFCGTTGEASTLSEDEWKDIVRFAVKTAGGRTPVIIGCGSNNTAKAENRSSFAEKCGADAILHVTPYYNKASLGGLITHYESIAKSVDIPVILYNVPSRTGVDIPLEAYEKLAKIPNICGVKEASGSVFKAASIISLFGDDMPVYSGCDEINLPILSVGGVGCISVISNIFPDKLSEMCRLAFDEKYKKAAELSASLAPLVSALFCEVNPIPVKTALYEMGLCSEEFRLPLCRISPEKRGKVTEELKKSFRKEKLQ